MQCKLQRSSAGEVQQSSRDTVRATMAGLGDDGSGGFIELSCGIVLLDTIDTVYTFDPRY